MAQSAGAKGESVVGMVRDPIGTITNAPKAGRGFFGRIGEGLKGGKSREEDGRPLAGITGVKKTKAQLAVRLGVRPCTTNEELQHDLTATTQATWAA